MKNNKLISEFMGYNSKEEIHYNTSWDLLIPVVQKCRQENRLHYFDRVYYAIEELDIDVTYNAVVKFIKEQKNLEIMKDNKLISKFMGYNSKEEIHYNTSWDRLMPVVHKIKETDFDFDVLEIGLPINNVHQAVVEFIEEQNSY